jgi:voltage-gated potassium channel Kch
VGGILRQIFPVADLLVGGGMLVFIVLLHGFAMRMITIHVIRRAKVIGQHPTAWRADALIAAAAFLLLCSHLVETGVWTAALVLSRMVPSWRDAGYFAANTYTTLGYGNVVLPEPWKMLTPIMAISGLFTFGWTGSVLVDVVSRTNRLRELAENHGQSSANQGTSS